MICQDQYQRNICPFLNEYFIRICVHILYVYTNISPAFITFIDFRSHIISIFPCTLLSLFFSCSFQRRKDINVIYRLRITVGFQLNHSGLENKRTEVIVFFPICITITMEGRERYCGWLNKDKENEDAGNPPVYTCFALLTLNSTHHMYLRKRHKARKGLYLNTNQTQNKF